MTRHTPAPSNRPPATVTLVGAGPVTRLLTLKNSIIQRNTVLFVDDLVSAEVVAFSTRAHRFMSALRTQGVHDLHWLMIMAKKATTSMRLKGGDHLSTFLARA
jgi:uroporphyrin-III C-methyltransferase